MANRIISRWARKHATGMPSEFYTYPKSSMVYTGLPLSSDFVEVTDALKQQYKEAIDLGECKQVITVVGGSQGGAQLNEDVAGIIGRIMQKNDSVGLVHVTGPLHEEVMKRRYAQELLADERRRIIVKGFVDDAFRYLGAADVVISRASATFIAELAVQGKAVILVPGKLADDHQATNARHLEENGAAVQVAYGDREGLYAATQSLLSSKEKREKLSMRLHQMAKPHATKDLAQLLMSEFGAGKRGGS
jgi:UDP-N-acetylglucosamine--N-acetylmuramyl-(pentapeptide) pyrophosphoryl-undecaprenol N-acetylglucosamine transferase